jgi:hypothetical protein
MQVAVAIGLTVVSVGASVAIAGVSARNALFLFLGPSAIARERQ